MMMNLTLEPVSLSPIEDPSPKIRKPLTETCLVCGAATRGLHFQVASCRACAAFYRRSVKAKKVYKCRRGSRNCDLTKPPNGKPICRFCRLQKCYAVGMRIEKDAADETMKDSSDASPVCESPDDPTPFRVVDGNRFERDIDRLVVEIKGILNSTERIGGCHALKSIHMTPFQQLQYAFAQFRGEVCPSEPVEPVEVFDKLSSYPFYEQYAKKVAEMLMACDPFVHLPFEDKWRLFRHAWPLVNHLERQFSSCELFGYNLEDQRMLMTKDVAIDFGRSQFVVDGMDPQKLQEYMKFCFPLKQGMTEMIRTPMKQLQLTEFEVCYMVGLVVFSVTEVRGLSEETRIIGEQIADQFSSELHNYYTYELKLKNYAARHAKLIRLISCAQQLNHTVKDHMVMAKIFDLFITDIYESELYE